MLTLMISSVYADQNMMQNALTCIYPYYATKFICYNHIIYKMLQAEQKLDPATLEAPAAEQISETSSKNNQQSNIYYTKNKRIIFWLYLLVGVIFVVSQATLVSENWKNYQSFSASDSFYLANQVASQWGKGFIIDMVVTNSASCPSGYQNAFNFTWPGTSFGCFCQVNANSSFVLQGYCSPKLIQTSCRNIESKAEILATIWKNSAHICMKRSSVSFKTEQKYNGNNKICGSSKSLTIMPSSEPCPFVNATFGIPSLQDHYLRFTDSSNLLSAFYGTYNSTSPYSFYSYPISKFAVSEYEFCLIDQDSGLTPDRVQFVLLNQRRGCADTGVYQTLDSITEIQFYANNPSLNALSSTNGFPKPGSQVYSLGFANLPSWTYNCRHNYDNKFSIPKALQIINFQFFQSYYYVALVQILLYSVLGFQLFILVIRRILKREVYPVGYRQMYLPKDFCLALTRYVIDFVCKLAILGLLIYTAWVIFVNWNWFKSALNLGCPDKDEVLINKVMEPFRSMYQQSLYYIVSQLIIFTFVAVIDLIHFIYIYRNDLRYYLVDSYGKVMVEHDGKDQLDWIDKEGDKKFLNLDSMMDKDGGNNVNDAASEKFRVTMAMNVFDNDKIENEPGKPRIVKKKKKKFSPFKKGYENNDAKNSDQFNPLTIEDPSIIGLNSIDNLSGERPEQQQGEQFKSIRKDRRRRKK